MATKKKKRAVRILTGIRLDPAQIGRIEDWCYNRSAVAGFEVAFSTAIRVLLEAGLNAHEAQYGGAAQ